MATFKIKNTRISLDFINSFKKTPRLFRFYYFFKTEIMWDSDQSFWIKFAFCGIGFMLHFYWGIYA